MLNIENLKVRIKDKPILSDVTLTSTQGQIHLILGPNGSGKSTLAKSIAGDPQLQVQGKIKFADKDLVKLGPTERSIQGVFLAHQNPVAIPGITVEELLRLLRRKHYPKKESIAEFSKLLGKYLKLVGLPNSIRKREFNVGASGGEKKKLELVQMLLVEPKLIVLDELDSGVDVDSLQKMAQIIREYVQTKQAIALVITHNLHMAEILETPFVHVLKNGQFVAETKDLQAKTTLLETLRVRGYDSVKR